MRTINWTSLVTTITFGVMIASLWLVVGGQGRYLQKLDRRLTMLEQQVQALAQEQRLHDHTIRRLEQKP